MADLEKLTVTLEANVADYNASLEKAAAVTQQQTDDMNARFIGLNKSVSTNVEAAAKRHTAATKQIAAGMSSVGSTALIAKSASERLVAGMSQAAVATDLAGHASSAASTSMQALFHALRGTTEGLALGAPLTQVMAQQISHLSYVASSPGGLTGAFKSLGGVLAGIFTPFRLVASGLAGLAVGAVAAAVSFANAQSRISLALTGIGTAAGVTVKDINAIAENVSKAGDLSRSEAADIATAIASTGKVSADATQKATGLAHAYSLVFGKDLTKSAQDLGQALADPAKGIDDLNARLGAFSDAERQAVKSLAAQNNLSAAQKIITDGLEKSIGKAADQTTIWARAWASVANSASDAVTAVGKSVGIVSQDPRDMLATAQSNLTNLQRGNKGGLGQRGFFSDPAAIAAAEAAVQKWTKAVEDANKQAADTKANVESANFGDIVRGIDPALSKLQALEDQLKHVNDDLNDPTLKIDDATRTAGKNASANLSGQIALEKQYIALAQQRFGITSDILGASTAQSAIDLQAINARTPAEKAEITFLQTQKQLRESGESAEAATAGATLERTKSLMQSYHDLSEAARDRVYQSGQTVEQGTIENATIGRSVDVATRLTQQFQLLAAAKQEAFKNGTQVSAAEQLDALVKADELARQAVNNAQKAATVSAQFDISQLSRTGSEQNVYSTLNSAGLLDNGKIVSAQAQQTAAILRTKEALTDLNNVERGFASDFAHDLLDGKNAATALGDALKNVASKLLDMGLDKLISTANGGLFSSLGSIFHLADGGTVRGPGSSRSDSIPAMLSPGEEVINADAASKNRSLLKAINAGKIGKFASGGTIGNVSIPTAVPSSNGGGITIAPTFVLQNGTPAGVQAAKKDLMPDFEKRMRSIVVDTLNRSAAAKKAIR